MSLETLHFPTINNFQTEFIQLSEAERGINLIKLM